MYRLILLIALVVSALALSACNHAENPVAVPEASAPVAAKSGVVAGSSTAAGATGLVTVIHGVPGLTVDVYVNGALTLPGFAPSTITKPLALPEGNYRIQITPAGKDTTQTVISGSTFLPAGANVSIIAHLTEAGAPTLSVYVNDLKGLAEGKSRLVVRHTAAAPAVDVNLYRGNEGRKVVGKLPGLSNPAEIAADVRPGRYTATLSPAGSSTVVFGPAPLRLRPENAYIVYAIGSLNDGSFGLLVQKIALRGGDRQWSGENENDDTH